MNSDASAALHADDHNPLTWGARIAETIMLRAASRGEVDIINALIATGTDVNARHDLLLTEALSEWGLDGMSPLHVASMEGHTDIVRILLDNGADIESRDKCGCTPLLIAAEYGRVDIVKLLIADGGGVNTQLNDGTSAIPVSSSIQPEYQRQAESVKERHECANINARNKYGMSPLHIASMEGHSVIVRILLDNGADIESRDEDGCTQLLIAAKYKRVDTVKLLTGDGGGVNTQLNDRTSAISAYSFTVPEYHRQAESVKERHEGADINARGNIGMSALNIASRIGHTDIVRILLDNGADIENRDWRGRTPLLNAAVNGHVHTDILKLLIGDGREADVEAENVEGERPIHYVVRWGGVELVALLIQHGANVGAADVDGNRPLHVAVRRGLNVVQLLVQHGAKLNIQNNDGETPLHIAVQRRQTEVIMFLLSQDADVGLTDVRRNTPIHYFTSKLGEMMKDKGFGEYLTKLLIKKHQQLLVKNLLGVSAITHATHTSVLKNIIYVRFEKIVAETLTYRYVDCQGNTPLHYALEVYGSELKMFKPVEFLLKRGVDINAQNNDGLTPLHVALSMNNNKEIVNLCLQYANKLSFRIIDKRGRNFWHLLFILAHGCMIKVILDICLQHVCDVSSAQNVDDLGRTPRHYACIRKSVSRYPCEVLKKFVNMTFGDEHIKAFNVHVRDNFGRTALHYANNAEDLLKIPLLKKVNDSIEDMFGKTYRDYTTISYTHVAKVLDVWRLHETHFGDFVTVFSQRLSSRVQLRDDFDRISLVRNIYLGCQVNYADYNLLKDSVLYSERHERKREIKMENRNTLKATQSTGMFAAIDGCVRKAMQYLASKISARDKRFACEVVAVGSAYEGTKIECCDEFDYNFLLTNLSKMCKVTYSPESPPGFVLLKALTPEYDEDLFNCDGTLDTTAVKFKFDTLVKEILSSLSFCEMTGFEFLDSPRAIFADKRKCYMCIKLTCIHVQPVNGHHVPHKISIDIVPALQINDWWPGDARRQDLCQTDDRLIVFKQPQNTYPWVGWTEPHGFISFARAESRLMRQCTPVVTAAYI